ncbi:MAG TPA: N-acetyltransferase [Candidatus Limnocylindria bacterium]|nr:N-acetyltransferase [Candidatus Limnocylindria bacterium]
MRPAGEGDRAAIFEVESVAFGRADEAQLVERILASKSAVLGLEFVAEDDGPILGHILFSHVELLTQHGPRRVLALAPMAVLPERQGQGVGTALVRAGLDAAERLGEPLIVVLGHAEYYPRFGFVPAHQLGVSPPPEYPASHFFALPLSAYEPALRGRIAYPPSFAEL